MLKAFLENYITNCKLLVHNFFQFIINGDFLIKSIPTFAFIHDNMHTSSAPVKKIISDDQYFKHTKTLVDDIITLK